MDSAKAKSQRVLSLTVVVDSESDDVYQVFQDLSELGANLGEVHDYVNVSSGLVEDLADEASEELRYDENTLQTVRAILGSTGMIYSCVEDVLNEFAKAGIVFRERVS